MTYLYTAVEIDDLVKDFWNGSNERQARREHCYLTRKHVKYIFKMVLLVKDELTNHIRSAFSSELTELINELSNAVVSDTSQVYIADTDVQAVYHIFVNDRLPFKSKQSL